MAVKKSGAVVISDAGLIDWANILNAPLNLISDVKLGTIGNCVGHLSGTLSVTVATNGSERTINFGLTGTNCNCNCNCYCQCQCY